MRNCVHRKPREEMVETELELRRDGGNASCMLESISSAFLMVQIFPGFSHTASKQISLYTLLNFLASGILIPFIFYSGRIVLSREKSREAKLGNETRRRNSNLERYCCVRTYFHPSGTKSTFPTIIIVLLCACPFSYGKRAARRDLYLLIQQ